ARVERAAGMVAKLAALGVPIHLERVLEIAGKGTVARPHVAEALLEAGHVATRQQAFDRYIGNEGPAYVHHYELSIEDAIGALHEAGGVAVLAHPVRVKNYATHLPGWVAAGLDGLEVYYPDHGPLFTANARVLARQHGLIMTGGSDFHRMEDGEIRLGTQDVPPECVEQLLTRAAQYR
ncbi:MAG: PHP domain-containing protein, partial [Anaerolineae bacterium]|nr:PHP domain-containing protein [Anaerolineae bacterium]